MATFYADEASIYKCPRHPSKRRRTGVCPACLKERLSALCPDCATPRPCSCCSSSASSSSSSSSSTSSEARISSLLASEPPFIRRSVSAAPAFPRFDKKQKLPPTEPPKSSTKSTKTASFWAVLWPRKAKKDCHKVGGEGGEERASLRRSRTVAAGSELRSSAAAAVKWKIWYFPSPMKVFKQSKVAKVVLNERSPLHRG